MQRAEDVIRPSLGNHRVYEAIDGIRAHRANANCPNCNAVLSYEGGLHCDYCGARFERPTENMTVTVATGCTRFGASAEETAKRLHMLLTGIDTRIWALEG